MARLNTYYYICCHCECEVPYEAESEIYILRSDLECPRCEKRQSYDETHEPEVYGEDDPDNKWEFEPNEDDDGFD